MSAHVRVSKARSQSYVNFLHFLQRTLFCLTRDDSELCKEELAHFLHSIRISMLCKIFWHGYCKADYVNIFCTLLAIRKADTFCPLMESFDWTLFVRLGIAYYGKFFHKKAFCLGGYYLLLREVVGMRFWYGFCIYYKEFYTTFSSLSWEPLYRLS